MRDTPAYRIWLVVAFLPRVAISLAILVAILLPYGIGLTVAWIAQGEARSFSEWCDDRFHAVMQKVWGLDD